MEKTIVDICSLYTVYKIDDSLIYGRQVSTRACIS
jgi:hypothetical protein